MSAQINIQSASPEVAAYLGEGGKLLAKSGLDEDLLLSTSHHTVEDVRARLKENFTDREIAFLTLAVSTINTWNRY